MVGKSLEAAEILEDKNINTKVINLRTLRPLDIDPIIESVKKTNKFVTCEEGFLFLELVEISALITEKRLA